MTRRIFTVAAAAVLVLTGALYGGGQFTLSGNNTTIKFVGTKKNGRHDCGVKEMTGTANVEGTDPATLKVSVDLDMNTIYADVAKLTNHLKSPDFFGVKSNPKAKFVSSKVEKSGDAYKITGDLTMCGQTKSISFPATIAVNGGTLKLSSKFKIDRTQWGMMYGRGMIDDEVAISVSISAMK